MECSPFSVPMPFSTISGHDAYLKRVPGLQIDARIENRNSQNTLKNPFFITVWITLLGRQNLHLQSPQFFPSWLMSQTDEKHRFTGLEFGEIFSDGRSLSRFYYQRQAALGSVRQRLEKTHLRAGGNRFGYASVCFVTPAIHVIFLFSWRWCHLDERGLRNSSKIQHFAIIQFPLTRGESKYVNF